MVTNCLEPSLINASIHFKHNETQKNPLFLLAKGWQLAIGNLQMYITLPPMRIV